ncbi:MAG: VOC family protein [Pseudomonadota bacterium]
MHINPYLNFGGRCAEAFAFYKNQLDAQDLALMPFRGSPAETTTPAEWQDKIMHGSLTIGSTTLMGTDGMPGQPYQGITGCSITLNVDSDAQASRLFQALAEKGTVTMAQEKTFWASSFGMLTDQFGIEWMVMHQGQQA